MKKTGMSHQFIAFHTMVRGSGKPGYIVTCARKLAESGANVLIMDGLMYEQGAVALQIYEQLGSKPVVQDGKNLYDLIADYETLCGGRMAPPAVVSTDTADELKYEHTRVYRNKVYPDVLGRIVPVPGYPHISYLPGNNGDVVEVRERIDFNRLFESHSGHSFFRYIREELAGHYDFVLLNAPAGHQEISGILCGDMADLILAIDVDSPAIDSSPSFEACKHLAQRVQEEQWREIEVKSLKGQDAEQILQIIGQNG